jgi:hypothetical protein
LEVLLEHTETTEIAFKITEETLVVSRELRRVEQTSDAFINFLGGDPNYVRSEQDRIEREEVSALRERPVGKKGQPMHHRRYSQMKSDSSD